MPNTPAQKVIAKFTKRLNNSIEYHRELILAVHQKKRQASLETMLAEQFVLNIGVLWEVFINELLLSYLIASPNRFSKNLKTRLLQSIDARFGSTVRQSVTFSTPKELSIAKASALADPKNYNITVNSSDELTARANELLAAKYARLFTLQPEDAQLINFIVAMRNHLAHRSVSARARLKKATSLLSGANASLQGSVSNIGVYFKKRDANNDTRSILIAKRLIYIANVLM